jgi:hypothetical protein
VWRRVLLKVEERDCALLLKRGGRKGKHEKVAVIWERSVRDNKGASLWKAPYPQ